MDMVASAFACGTQCFSSCNPCNCSRLLCSQTDPCRRILLRCFSHLFSLQAKLTALFPPSSPQVKLKDRGGVLDLAQPGGVDTSWAQLFTALRSGWPDAALAAAERCGDATLPRAGPGATLRSYLQVRPHAFVILDLFTSFVQWYAPGKPFAKHIATVQQ